jgi:RsiW-degrading membrane proteinase PrsW (M82 family)
MKAATPRRPARGPAFVRSAWLRTLGVGLALYAVVTIATVVTGNLHLVPSVILLGSLLVPVTFVVYVFERVPIGTEVIPALATCFVVGGLVGTAAASILEYETLRDLGVLPMLAVGLIEESVKLVVPLVIFRQRRFLAPAAGVLFGVTAGMGFASFESMGYGLAELIQSGGQIGATEALLAIRGVLSPTGHAAWTGLVCAALWRARARRPRARAYAWVAAAFLTAVVLHALWDATDSLVVAGLVASTSAALLATQLRALRPRARKPDLYPHRGIRAVRYAPQGTRKIGPQADDKQAADGEHPFA